MRKVLLIAAMMMFSISLYAEFEGSIELRPRSEYSHGYGMLSGSDQDASLFTTQRTRLNGTYTTEGVKAKLVLQDVRLWGSQPQLVMNEDFAVSIHEAWGEVDLFERISLKLGRQELIYDDHRIFGNVGWAQQARSHDVALLKFEDSFKLHFGLAYNENSNRTNSIYPGPDAYKTMQFIWFNNEVGNINYSILFLNNGVPRTTMMDNQQNILEQEIHFNQTVGPRIAYTNNGFAIDGYFYYQMGETVIDTSTADLSAICFGVNVNGQVTDAFRAGAGFELLSGNDLGNEPAASGENKAFTPFYGTNHKFNGFMDYFYVGNHVNNIGLMDIVARFAYKIKSSVLKLDIHQFMAAGDTGDQESGLGTEIDFTVVIPANDFVTFQGGYSHMLPTETMQLLKGGEKDETQNWAYLMMSFNLN